ncbi:carbohydrate ABC transporter permease [Nonomuraea zeae]|uniref:Carbohydrate ABC transporter permease n=1 Tax=Nonomuraea zeae TaxID=1642303 RepID=A0A5S4G146_9ACTN|nr:carbohydrate ABC transporter permease [Nonomuraea zeae]
MAQESNSKLVYSNILTLLPGLAYTNQNEFGISRGARDEDRQSGHAHNARRHPGGLLGQRRRTRSVPDDLIAAARLDGANELRIYWSIVLPLARPALVTSAVFQFVWTWTDFMNPLIYLNDSEKYTLSIGLYAFFAEHDIAWGPLMAACVLFTIPALLIFILGQRYFVGGISTGALK